MGDRECLICLKPGAETEARPHRMDATWQRCHKDCRGEFYLSGPAKKCLKLLEEEIGAEKAGEVRSLLSGAVRDGHTEVTAEAVEAARYTIRGLSKQGGR